MLSFHASKLRMERGAGKTASIMSYLSVKTLAGLPQPPEQSQGVSESRFQCCWAVGPCLRSVLPSRFSSPHELSVFLTCPGLLWVARVVLATLV